MSDGREEREEREARLKQQQKKENPEDRVVDRDDLFEWEPERVDS
jgi:hypothetical protein